MQYSELQEYDGEKTRCDNCEREFKSGEVVTVEVNKNLVFCYSDCGGGCLIPYIFIYLRRSFIGRSQEIQGFAIYRAGCYYAELSGNTGQHKKTKGI